MTAPDRLRTAQTTGAAVPVTVLGGFLGAGKTTLLNHLLRHGDRCAVLINDFGTINIDAELIDGREGDMIRLANGCICCSLTSGFVDAMSAIRSMYEQPERVLIETSGVSDPRAVAQYAHLPGFQLDSIIVVADAETVQDKASDRYVARTVLRQLQSADLLLLNKVDLVTEGQLATTRAWLIDTAPSTRIIETVDATLPLDVAFGPDGNENSTEQGRLTEHLSHQVDYASWSVSRDEPIDRVRLRTVTAALPGSVLRGKGVVVFTDDPAMAATFQMVGSRTSIGDAMPSTAPPRTQLVFVGLAGTEAAAAVDLLIRELFADPTPGPEECP